MPSRPRDDKPKGQERQGNTLPAQGDRQERAPRAPHERDESADSQGASDPSARSVGQAASEDIERGLVDTDKGPVLDEVYDRVREGADDPLKKFSP
ncbi:MAG: hypothetical protein Q8R01_16210 [Ramlibacter sp.]|nr:hypothetical protein [Ramlibacter sp.]